MKLVGTINLSTESCALRRSKRVKIDQKMPETCLRKDKQFKQLFNAQNIICAAPKSFLSLSKYYFQRNVNWRKDKKYCQFIVCTLAVAPSISLHCLLLDPNLLRSVLANKLCSTTYVPYQSPTGRELKWTRYLHTVISVFK